MNAIAQTASIDTARSRTLGLAAAGFLSLFIIGVAGFANIHAVHNAGHDYRHSMAFPCH